ncbi:alpha-sialidase [Prauserella marina]|uniref:exo-alpha-sialidase n=1 Tax=Prauserella marina TaxID=530584 RepID=A0A222VWM9_9PSEU|nr:sialidase family protein [Prauserella marina]ASR38317.1 alpha-sialidase [Prauserella marina]PWV78472.1 sialidase-1 [Prauserella marina]SDC86779.1 sialidase-1 [Prauserella marina]
MSAMSRRTVLSLAAATAAGLAVAAPASAAMASRATSIPYRSGTEGYHTFRIPALVRTRTGQLLAFAEGRLESAGDSGAIEVVLRRSTDGGRTWGPLAVISRNGDATAGNPSPVVLADGTIVLVTTRNGRVTEEEIMSGTVSDEDSRRVFVQHSFDDGLTFTEAREITAEAKEANWRWYATGPCHAIVLRGGRYAGRIVVPANHSSAPPAGSPDVGTEQKYYGGHCLLSDDGGRSWRIGFVDDRNDGHIAANETTVAELPDGTLYFNSRDHGTSPGERVDAYSGDGGATLVAPYREQPTIVGPRVQGSVLQASHPKTLLFSGPSNPDSRRSMSIRVSADGGRNWREAYTVSEAHAAYSDLVEIERGTIGLLYETGAANSSETIAFHRFATPRD